MPRRRAEVRPRPVGGCYYAPMLSTFDHLTLIVSDLEHALDDYRRLLGSDPSSRAEHPEHGSRTALFGLSNAALELVAPSADAVASEGLRRLLRERGEGLSALAFGTSDAAALSASFRARGLRATAPQPGTTEEAGGRVRHYQTVELSPRTTRGIHVFAVERADLSELRAEAPVPTSAVDALDHVVLRTSSPEAAIALYRDALGLRLALDRTFGGVRMLFFRIGGVTLEVVEDASLGEHDVLHGVAYRVRDCAAAHARMREAGLTVSDERDGKKPGTRVFSVRSGTAGVPTLVLRDPARD